MPHTGTNPMKEHRMTLTDTEILGKLTAIIEEETGLSPQDISPAQSFAEDLDIDSLTMMTVVVNAEEAFGVRIPDDAIKNLRTVQDAVDYIAAARG